MPFGRLDTNSSLLTEPSPLVSILPNRLLNPWLVSLDVELLVAAVDVVEEDELVCSIVVRYFCIAVNKACTNSPFAPALSELDDSDAEDEDDVEEDSPGGGPGGGPWLAMADTNWLWVRLPLPLVSSRLHIWVA